RIPSLEPNDTAVVLLLETCAGGVLLGADLEHVISTRLRGWHAVLDHNGRPKLAASLFKIPHHGSGNADCPEVWERMIEQDAVCILTPFELGSVALPRPADRQRIRNRTSNGYISSNLHKVAVERDRATKRMIAEATRLYRPETLTMGHVQARSNGAEWQVRLSDASSRI